MGWFVIGPLYHYRAELNGYPFQPGDRVLLLTGANRGWVAPVKEVWDWRGTLVVDFADAPRPKANKYFGFVEVIKADRASGLPPTSGTTLT